jgi:serine/threonine-protein kinase
MGEVYRADDLHLGQPVALKFLPADMERDPVRLERFIAEVRTARQISHPNICRVYDLAEFEGRRFLSMEYIDGEDLRSLLRRIGRLPEDKGLQIARQLCAGLAAMHDRGVLHRDLKPANVMIDGDGRVRLTDFGLAAAAADATGGEIAGTPAYMAPEQLAGEALTPQTDLYALGLLLFEVFTGERVLKSDKPGEVREQQRASGTTPLSKTSGAPLDPAIGRVIARCVEHDPAKRPASAIAVAAALPGGDPLAAALAAGETPSPQLVAASGGEGTLPAKVGVPLLVAVLVLFASVAWLNQRRLYTGLAPFPYSAEVLTTKAREMLGRFGYSVTPADSGYGFRTDSNYPAWIMKRDQSRARWQQYASVRGTAPRFWYRTSPQPLTPGLFLNSTVTSGDPPHTLAGMVYISLELDGRLNALNAVMPDREAPAAAVAEPDWSRLFAEAGFDMAAFRRVAPERKAPAGADARAAWVGPGADATGTQIRIEVAAHRGQFVFFDLTAPWDEPDNAGSPAPRFKAEDIVAMTIIVTVLGLATLLAIRNARTGRADTRGATRLAVVMGLITLASGVFDSHLTLSLEDFPVLANAISAAAFMALLTWAFYVALEPYARRRWPQMLVSWNRLLEGRWRDPLIGRDLLVGSATGLAFHLLGLLSWFLAARPPVPLFATDAWQGLGHALVTLPLFLPVVGFVAFGFILLLVGLRIVLRREWLAILALVIVFDAMSVLQEQSSPMQLVLVATGLVGLVLVTTRFGLIAMFVGLLIGNLLTRYGVSLTPPPALVGPVVAVAAVMLAPAVFGFFTSRRRGPAGLAHWLD